MKTCYHNQDWYIQSCFDAEQDLENALFCLFVRLAISERDFLLYVIHT